MLLQPITVPFSKSTLKPSVYTLRKNIVAVLRSRTFFLKVNKMLLFSEITQV